MKTWKIVEIVKTREYDYEWKKYYATTMKLDNDDQWECSKAKPDFFTVGQSITYEITEWQYGNKIKLEQTQQAKKTGTWQKDDPVEKFIWFSASYAKDLIECWKVELKDFGITADMFLNWMTNKHSSIKPAQAPQVQQTTPVAQTSTSDLITPEQIKYAHTLWSKTGLNDESWKKYISDTYKVWSSKDLTKTQASEFIEYIKTLEPMPLPTKPVDDDLPF